MSLHVLITGGAGYLGVPMAEAFLQAGHWVTIADDFRYGQTSILHLCHDPRLAVIRGDVRDLGGLAAALAKADVVVPLAALVGAPLCAADPFGAETINRDAVTGLADRLSADQLLIYPATNSVYGSTPADTVCTETSPTNPVSLYGTSKAEAERHVMQRRRSISLRLATVFGLSPRMRVDLLVNDFVRRAVADGAITLFEAEFRRNFLHVRDVARAFVHAAAQAGRMSGEIYNVGLSGVNLTKLELCDQIRQQVPRFSVTLAATGGDPDKRNYMVSNEKVEATGYATSRSLDDGIAELVKLYRWLAYSPFENR